MTVFINKLCCKNLRLLKQSTQLLTRRFVRQVQQTNEEPLKGRSSKYTDRSYTCGELGSKNVGEEVVLCGWLEYQRMDKFLVLRDGYGSTQLLVDEKDAEMQKLVSHVPYESIIKVKGRVLSRPKEMVNTKQATGEVEVSVEELRVVNRARENLPFNIREFQKAKESLRMRYRYLDLRFPQMQRNLRVRSVLLMKMREFLINNDFVEVETPTLFKGTPGGAQEFIVPTRYPGQFYSLVQSPQQFKQMLMAGAIDRYFQIARCYRDENTRSDRQPEFTQLDIEMSFTDVDGVIRLIEEVLNHAWPDHLGDIPPSFPRMAYKDAMEMYGSDKPDVRFEFKLNNCTDLVKSSPKLVTEEDFGAYFITFPKEYANLGNKMKETMKKLTYTHKKPKLIQSKVINVKDWISKISKLFGTQLATSLAEEIKLGDGEVLFLAYGDKTETLSLLGQIRLAYVDFLEDLGITIRKKGMHFLWIVDFPLFETCRETGELQSAHHPFTSPHPEDLDLLQNEPRKVRALAYDLVLNGNEVGGGSIRMHDPSLQKNVLDILNIPTDTMPYFLEMLGSGCPPHGGIALGLDRLLAVLLNATSIRDVIAFPKNFEGRDPVSGAPSRISEEEKRVYHVRSVDCDEK